MRKLLCVGLLIASAIMMNYSGSMMNLYHLLLSLVVLYYIYGEDEKLVSYKNLIRYE
ncbi:hypothetical protein [Alkalihalobacillus sp. R86527]|uniref:hypothetical protein n=1 Tax=Alkalihalobacillus sp. R86527 TaxID=3093863 RepID=UPI00366C5334